MTIWRRLIILLGMALTPALVAAQAINGEITLVNNYDLDSTSYVYCVEIGQNENVWGANILSPGTSRAITSGSSTGITLAAGPTLAFSVLTAGDEIIFNSKGAVGGGSVQPLGTQTTRVVTAVNNSGADITVNAAIDLSVPAVGTVWTWRKRACGDGTGSLTGYLGGWIPMNDVLRWNFQFTTVQLDVTGGIDYKVECKQLGYLASPVVVIPATNITATGSIAATSELAQMFDVCRFGFKIGSADDGADTTTHTEKLGVYLKVVR